MAKFMVFYEGKPLNTYIIDEPVITIGRLPENTISIANMGVSGVICVLKRITTANTS
jgi:pSer/pThr/pTyr-binding forkhead associated (FHA) protein